MSGVRLRGLARGDALNLARVVSAPSVRPRSACPSLPLVVAQRHRGARYVAAWCAAACRAPPALFSMPPKGKRTVVMAGASSGEGAAPASKRPKVSVSHGGGVFAASAGPPVAATAAAAAASASARGKVAAGVGAGVDVALARSVAAAEGLEAWRAEAALALLTDGNTLPFVARYRKDVHGGLDETQLRRLQTAYEAACDLRARRAAVLRAVEALEPPARPPPAVLAELARRIEAAPTLGELEELYAPYKQKRRTRATAAYEAGLGVLADLLWEEGSRRGGGGARRLEEAAAAAAAASSGKAADAAAALAGARDILAERVATDPALRAQGRALLTRRGCVAASVVEAARKDERAAHARKFETYAAFQRPLASLKPHQTLALARGQALKVLHVKLQLPEAALLPLAERAARLAPAAAAAHDSPAAAQVRAAVGDGLRRLLWPSLERAAWRDLHQAAMDASIQEFAVNLRALLMQPPLQGAVVLGLDPGFASGCKAAVTSATGAVVDTLTFYPFSKGGGAAAAAAAQSEARRALRRLLERHAVDVVAIGDGTASRETELLVSAVLEELKPEAGGGGGRGRAPKTKEGDGGAPRRPRYAVVSEAGASVYSASEVAVKELPDLDVTLRGAVSIARRLQDPLAELVKVSPEAIGVGMYQHDVDQKALARALADVVESVVNAVGVDLNTASPHLLTHVAGIGPKLATTITDHRSAHGAFAMRQDLLKVKGVGKKTFEQAAGFLRVHGGANELDETAVHPESYPVVAKLLAMHGVGGAPGRKPGANGEGKGGGGGPGGAVRERLPIAQLLASVPKAAKELGVGPATLTDILHAVQAPGRDPRSDVAPPQLRSGALHIEDLQVGSVVRATVRNVVPFGAFVDVGVKQDGLVHVSQMAQRGRVSDPHTVVKVGDAIWVRILEKDVKRSRISLSMKDIDQQQQQPAPEVVDLT